MLNSTVRLLSADPARSRYAHTGGASLEIIPARQALISDTGCAGSNPLVHHSWIAAKTRVYVGESLVSLLHDDVLPAFRSARSRAVILLTHWSVNVLFRSPVPFLFRQAKTGMDIFCTWFTCSNSPARRLQARVARLSRVVREPKNWNGILLGS